MIGRLDAKTRLRRRRDYPVNQPDQATRWWQTYLGCVVTAGFILAGTGLLSAQTVPATITLPEALTRARQFSGQLQTANTATLLATQDRLQVRAAQLPSVNAFNQFIYTQANGSPSGVFVANDGVHIYNEQAVVHEEVLALLRKSELRRAMAAEAIARARVSVAARGLTSTVVQSYYAIVLAQRKFNNTQASLAESRRFLDITQKLEKGGEAARSDVVKAQIDLQQRQRESQEAQLAIDKAKIALGVLIFPNLLADFTSGLAAVDDLQPLALLPEVAEAKGLTTSTSPDLTVAKAAIDQAGYDIQVARQAYLPSLGVDLFYGFDANQLTARRRLTAENPDPTVRNFGYVAQATLNIPVWNWGATRSKIRQAEIKREQAQLDLSLTERAVQAKLATLLAEARVAQTQLDSLRQSVDLATESLRLTLLRYQAGEATALEVVDAQTTLTTARNAYDDGLSRYRLVSAEVQILTGNL